MKTASIALAFAIFSPLFCGCTHAKGDDSDNLFEYKEIYLPEGEGKQARQLGLNSVDTDWGIWGHNLKRVLPADASMAVYAQVEGQRTKEQLCFTSDKLYRYIESYIDENFDEDDDHRFAILPCDNSLVCLCEQCAKAGNQPGNASPAVFSMIERLAKRFPNHIFFTSYYLTTRSLPDHVMPQNTGVLVSTMGNPLSPVASSKETAFEELLKEWRAKVSRVYVWDYVNNFDDYFTPFPLFNIMQHRMRLFAKAGVSGIFLNGSGTDYSTLSHLRTLVFADLMRDPGQDVARLVREHCAQLYPVAGKAIADFVLQQEEWTREKGTWLPIYEGVAQAKRTYLPEKEFITFYEQLCSLLPQTKGKERQEVELMCQAMAMTRLELMRLDGDITGYASLLQLLAALPQKGVKVYSETCWPVEGYVKDYTAMAQHWEATHADNCLLGKRLEALTALDEEYNDISKLTNGLLGLPSNYHCGQMLSSADPALKIAIPRVEGMKTLKVWFTRNVLFHILPPLRMTLTAGGRLIGEATPATEAANPYRGVVEFHLPDTASEQLVLTIVRNKEDRTMAIDEIEGFLK